MSAGEGLVHRWSAELENGVQTATNRDQRDWPSVVPSAALAAGARPRPPSEFRTQPQGFQAWNPAEAASIPPPGALVMTCGHYLRFAHATLRFRTSPGSALNFPLQQRATGSQPTSLYGGPRLCSASRSARHRVFLLFSIFVPPYAGTLRKRAKQITRSPEHSLRSFLLGMCRKTAKH